MLIKFSDWNAIMDKATRYLQDGKLNVTANTWTKDPNTGALSNYAAGTTDGDTGTWNTEIWRDDPGSNAITRWNCDCPWGEVSWGRTRQFKKFEGRPCAHCLALHWATQNAPQEPAPVDQGPTPQQPPQGQPGTPEGPTQTPNIPGAANITNPAETITKPTPIINEAPAQPLIQSQPLPPGQSPFGMGGFSHVYANEFYDDINSELEKEPPFQNGEYVRVKPGYRLIGLDRDETEHIVTGNRVGQIIFCDTEDAVVIFSLPNKAMEPHLVRVETNPESLVKAPSNMKPFTSAILPNSQQMA